MNSTARSLQQPRSWILLLFDFMFLEQDSLSYNRIEFDKGHLMLRVGDVFSCRIKETRPRGTEQFDGKSLALAPGE